MTPAERRLQATLTDPNHCGIVTASDEMRELLRYAKRVASSDAKVMITGETGVGKDIMARYIHAHSARRYHEYVAVNCAGLTESLLESELFGHVKGSFTGASRDRPGKLQRAHGGTLFLDELGEMTPRMQGMLLRFLENGEIHTVGAEASTMVVNVRVIAATNRNLSEMVALGNFREDLLYRLRVVRIHVPPLRERPEDVHCLGAHFLDGSEPRVTLTDEAWRVLARYQWPGNIRELQNVMEQVIWLASPGEPVTIAQLPPAVTGGGTALIPAGERRQQVADQLFELFTDRKNTFWKPIHGMFLARDLTRHDIRELVRRGLRLAGGNYRRVMTLFNIPDTDYKKFMNFLSTHDCHPKFREFRKAPAGPEHSLRALFPELRAPRRQARKRLKSESHRVIS
jgi:transcriptional regulator with PAS, ATPase and Fis domain